MQQARWVGRAVCGLGQRDKSSRGAPIPGVFPLTGTGPGVLLIREDCESQSFFTAEILELMGGLPHEVDPYLASAKLEGKGGGGGRPLRLAVNTCCTACVARWRA